MRRMMAAAALMGILGLWADFGSAEAVKDQAVGQEFGDAVETAKSLQIVRPEQPRKVAVPPGIAGKNAAAAMDNYHDSFRKVAPTPSTVNISIGK